jgi:hypothetical protein
LERPRWLVLTNADVFVGPHIAFLVLSSPIFISSSIIPPPGSTGFL